LIELFGNEINVLINVDVEKIASYDKLLARVIKMYRLNKLNVIVGRGGRYGQVVYDID
jgi:PHP family Zn ribbon phosphoesterase